LGRRASKTSGRFNASLMASAKVIGNKEKGKKPWISQEALTVIKDELPCNAVTGGREYKSLR